MDGLFLIHDHDTKFTEAFDADFEREDGGVVKTPIMAPIANYFIETWIGSLKRECLNLFYCFTGLNHQRLCLLPQYRAAAPGAGERADS